MNTMLTKKVIKTEEGYVTLTDYAETFTDKEIEAVYIVISAESVSWMDVPTFVKKYTTFVEGIVSVYPEAHIYVQPIFPINEEKAAKRGYSVTNEKIRQINEYIFEYAEENSIWILDLYGEFVNKEGILPEEYTTNGIRFEKETYEIWSNYVVTHKAH
jgi:lysophospholipase L1-like esterase